MTSRSGFLTRHKKVIIGLGIFIWAAAFCVTHIPAEKLPEFPTGDKTLHLIGYFVLCSVLLIMLSAINLRAEMILLCVVLFIPIYAAFDEITQPLVNRHASHGDWVANMLGGLIAILIWLVIRLVSRRQSRSE